MNQNIYIKLDRNNEVGSREVTIGDVASIYCTDSTVVNKLKTIRIMKIPENGRDSTAGNRNAKKQHIQKKRYSVSAMKVIELIQKEDPQASVEKIGEADFIVDYIDEKKRNHHMAAVLDVIKTVLICIVIFFGSGYAIMAYNNDVGTTEIFEKVYGMITGEEKTDTNWMELMYSVGLTGGIAVFYNHFGSKTFSNDPTPIEVEMNNYEQDLDYALIERGGRSGKEEDVQ